MIDCSICLSNIEKSNDCLTNCNHFFCKECLNKWLKHNLTCPMCRVEIKNYTNEGEMTLLINIPNIVPVNTPLVFDPLIIRTFNEEYLTRYNLNRPLRSKSRDIIIIGGSIITIGMMGMGIYFAIIENP